MDYRVRVPKFKITIVRPNYSAPGAYSESEVYTFDASESGRAVVAYSYKQDLADFNSPFSITCTPEPLKNGLSVMDIVRHLDIVKIEEYDEVKYIGVVNSRRYTATMADSGPERMITISGGGIGGVLAQFEMLLDQIILADARTTVTSLENQLKSLLSTLSSQHGPNASMTAVFKKIKDAFKEAMQKLGAYQAGTGIFKIVDNYLAFSADSDKLTTKYPLALSVFSYNTITLLGVWQELVFKPFYEFFIRWDDAENKYLLHLRPTPFDPEGWKSIKKTTISPIHVTGVDLGTTDAEVKTWFFSYLAGGGMSYETALYASEKTAPKKDSAKWALYGCRQLRCVFKYANEEELAKNQGKINLTKSTVKGDPVTRVGQVGSDDLMALYTEKLKAWFSRIDEMYNGSLTVMTMKNGPRVGERLEFEGMQFYVESVEGSWMYGAEMQTKYLVTRGGIYDDQGQFSTVESVVKKFDGSN